MYLDHFQILAIYGENMDKTKQYSQCCAIPRYQPYMEKVWTKLRKKAMLYHSQIPAIYVTSHAKTFRIWRKYGQNWEKRQCCIIPRYQPYMWPLTQKRSERLAIFKRIAVYQPFKRIGMLFERLELSVQKNSLAVRTAWSIRSKKFTIRSNGSSYPLKNIH